MGSLLAMTTNHSTDYHAWSCTNQMHFSLYLHCGSNTIWIENHRNINQFNEFFPTHYNLMSLNSTQCIPSTSNDSFFDIFSHLATVRPSHSLLTCTALPSSSPHNPLLRANFGTATSI